MAKPSCFRCCISVSVLLFFFGASTASAQTDPLTCLACHKKEASIMEGKHGAKIDPRSPFGGDKACSGCHGTNPEHASNPAKNPHPIRFTQGQAQAEEQTRACMNCHGGNRHLAFWESGRHARNSVRCNDCHAVHAPAPRGAGVAFTKQELTVRPFVAGERLLEYETCNRCHKQVRVQINKPSRHPILEGKVACSSCHNPHGAESHAMVKQETVNAQCWSCHSDKRGPFLFQHPAVEENCLSCHSPHGSSHTKLLNEKVPNLCQDCHDWSRHPGTAYSGDQGFVRVPGSSTTTPNTRFVARACLNCHNAIHGSNAPATRGKYLTR